MINKYLVDNEECELFVLEKEACLQAVRRWSKLKTGDRISIEGKGALQIDMIVGNKLCCQKPNQMFDYTSIYDLLTGAKTWQ